MKKTISVLIAALLLFTLCSCGELSAYQLYTNAQQKAEENKDNFEVNTLITLKLKTDESDKAIEKEYGVHVKKDGDNISSVVKTDIGMGITVESELVYSDGFVYAKVMGVKAKIKTDIEKFESDYTFENDMTPLFSEEDLKAVKVIKNEDGLREMKLTVSSEKINKSIYESVEQMMNAAMLLYGSTLGDENVEAEFSDINVTVVFDADGNFKNVDMSFSLTAEVFSKTVSASVTAEIEYLDFGSTSVEVPDDVENYKTYDFIPEGIFR